MPPDNSFGNSAGATPVGQAPADGSSPELAAFRGSPVVLVFRDGPWNPARDEQVAMYNRLIAHLPGVAGATLLGVGGSRPWRDLAFDDGSIALPVFDDASGDVARRFGVSHTPAVVVLDATGTVRWRHVGSDTARPGELARAVAESARIDGVDRRETAAWSRREFVATVLGAAFALTLRPALARAAVATAAGDATRHASSTARSVTLNVNGHDRVLDLEPRVTLLDALRDYAGLTGTKKGCDHGQCGACTVHVDGRRTLSCLTFAVMAEGKRITTIEGLAPAASAAAIGTDGLDPMQRAFIAHDGFQCGYCTSGQIMSATAMLREPWGPSDDDVREAMSGNICRCGAYAGIVAAIQAVRHGGGSPQ